MVARDLDITGRLAARLERSTSWGRAVGAAGLAAGFAAALREELDLRVEARNMTSVAAASDSRGSDGTAIPVPYQPLCTARVLVMERLDGRPLAAIGARTPADVRAALARSLLDCLLRQVMLEGTFHADPHPGNVLLLADGRLGLLDFGSASGICRPDTPPGEQVGQTGSRHNQQRLSITPSGHRDLPRQQEIDSIGNASYIG